MNHTLKALTLRAFFYTAFLFVSSHTPASQTEHGALHEAIEKGDLAAIRKLVDSGADVNAKNHLNLIALDYAKEKQLKNIIELLQKKRAK